MSASRSKPEAEMARACCAGDADAVERATLVGAPVNAPVTITGVASDASEFQTGERPTPLGLAAFLGHEAAVRRLLLLGADPNLGWRPEPTYVEPSVLHIRRPTLVTPLQAAAYRCSIGCLEALLEAGAKLKAAASSGSGGGGGSGGDGGGNGDGAVLHACASAEMAHHVLQLAPGQLEARGPGGRTPLMVACDMDDDGELVSLLLAAGADPNARDDKGRTPLMHAAYWGNEPAVAALLAAGARAGVEDNKRNPVLRYVGGLCGFDCEDDYLDIGGVDSWETRLLPSLRGIVRRLTAAGAVPDYDEGERTPRFNNFAAAAIDRAVRRLNLPALAALVAEGCVHVRAGDDVDEPLEVEAELLADACKAIGKLGDALDIANSVAPNVRSLIVGMAGEAKQLAAAREAAAEREAAAARQEASAAARLGELGRREAELAWREESAVRREAEQARRNKNAALREAELARREAELARAQVELRRREDEVRRQQADALAALLLLNKQQPPATATQAAAAAHSGCSSRDNGCAPAKRTRQA